MKIEIQHQILNHLEIIIKRMLISKSTRHTKIAQQLVKLP